MGGVYRSLNSRSSVLAAAIALIAVLALAICASAFGSPPRYELMDRFGPDGTDKSAFSEAGPVAFDEESDALYVLDSNTGELFKFASDGSPADWGGAEPYISGNKISGLGATEYSKGQIAADSSSHTVYVTSFNAIRAFQPDGEPSSFTAGPFAGSSELGGFGELAGVAVDSNGYIYASDRTEGLVKIFAPSGEPITHFAVANPANLAVDSGGSVYVVEYLGGVTKFTPSLFPVAGTTTYTAAPAPVESESSATVGIDPANDNVYVVHNLTRPGVSIFDDGGDLITVFGEPGSDGGLFLAGGIAIDGSSTRGFVGNRPSSGPSQVNVFQPEPPSAPAIEVRTVGGVSDAAATLYARINPDQKATTYRFEYGLGDCSVTICSEVPLGGGSLVAGNDGVWIAQKINGLSPGTQYYFRVIAENELGSDEASGVFRTQGSALGSGLADSRTWEMVSPANKHGALLRGIGDGGGLVQAAADGNGIAYISISPVEGEPPANRTNEPASVLARRSPSGWQSKDLTPPSAVIGTLATGQQSAYKIFSPDLSSALLEPRTGTPLSEEASERTPYLRENTEPPVYRPLATAKEGFANVPAGLPFGGGDDVISDLTVEAATPDLSYVALQSRVPLFEGAPVPGIYEWAAGELRPISIVPDDEGGEMVAAEAVGSGGSGAGAISTRHAISDDGSRVFWTSKQPRHLYMRDMEAGETTRINLAEEGVSGPGASAPVFQGASADGTVVYFTDTQQLTANASPAGADLYRCEVIDVGAGCVNLVDLTAPREGSGESGEMMGIVSALSGDGSRVYFVARGVLVTGANAFGAKAIADRPNLYQWQEGKGLTFLATLSERDGADWGFPGPGVAFLPGEASKLSATLSPNGRYFAFMSEEDITGQGTVDVNSGRQVEQVFRFDSDTGRLACISCSPDGAAPEGTVITVNELVDPRREWIDRDVAASLPQPTILRLAGHTAYQPRAVLDSGRVFFNAFGSLVPADANHHWDVYQYEDVGVGDCGATSETAAVQRSGEGCVSLISSGTGEAEAGFLDASATGDDVFFLTPARLSPADVDHALDVYDARVNGTLTLLNPKSECSSGESCRPSPSQPPDVAPGSAAFAGAGNVKPRRKCPKGKHKVKKGGKQRCVRNKAKKRHRRNGRGRGGSR